MKKKVLFVLFFLTVCLGLTGCFNKNIDNRNISLNVKEGTLSMIGVTLTLKNESKNNYSYEEAYYIEQENDDSWSKVQTIRGMGFNDLLWRVNAGESVEISINWLNEYGKLNSGKYRIVKEIFKSSSSSMDNSDKFNVYAEFEINEDDYEYEKETTEEIELRMELDLSNHGNSSDEFIKYKAYVKDNKLYGINLSTNEEMVVFDKEPVKNIAVRRICCAGDGYLLILTTNGNVYMSEKDCNYAFSFDFPFKKTDVKDIVSFKLIPAYDYDVAKNLYAVDSRGNEILLHKIN